MKVVLLKRHLFDCSRKLSAIRVIQHLTFSPSRVPSFSLLYVLSFEPLLRRLDALSSAACDLGCWRSVSVYVDAVTVMVPASQA